MGADKKSLTKKCGEILIKIKRNKKSKAYIFNCTFCNENSDQLKKFSLHLEEKHSHEFCNQPSPLEANESAEDDDIERDLVVDPEIKVEELMGIEVSGDYGETEQLIFKKSGDPLEPATASNEATDSMELDLKQEHGVNDSDGESNAYGFNDDDFICENSSGSESEDSYKPVVDSTKRGMTKIRKLKTEKLQEAADASSDDDSRNSDFDSMEAENSKSEIFVSDFVKSEMNVTYLIAAYKNQPHLWNRNSPQHRLREHHNKYLEKIRIELENKNVVISCNQIGAVIQYLCRRYRQDLKKMKLNEVHWEMLEDKNQVWFFKQLEFLKPFVEKNLSAALKIKQPDLLPEQIIQILAIYERFPHLWNTNLLEYVCRNKHGESLRQMLVVVESELELQLNEIELKKNIHFFHKHFARIKRCNSSNDNSTNIRSKYYNHMQFLYDHVGPFKCPVCGQVFKNPLTFKEHKSQHDGSYALKCSLCNKEYSKAGAYIVHARRHLDDLNEECKECGKRFITISDLKIHMRSHTGVPMYCCEICGVSFRHRSSLTDHRRRHQNEYLHTCPICSKGFYKKDRMNDHIRSHSQIREFVCKICGKAFIRRKTLKQHEVIHDDIRKHVCTLCGKAFKLKVGLIQHMRTHGGQI